MSLHLVGVVWRSSWRLGSRRLPTPSHFSAPLRLLRPAQIVILESTKASRQVDAIQGPGIASPRSDAIPCKAPSNPDVILALTIPRPEWVCAPPGSPDAPMYPDAGYQATVAARNGAGYLHRNFRSLNPPRFSGSPDPDEV
ncbi:hypothetical protein Taro_029042 [Colocasia esculenta]|uniref:Uncharacterized protein n=1 Tax=Colocasia esculenta TaxID=4460 RepID=A0A843VCV0_COLES|nr:hypothetical protein [Colocasia esculenta]